jgi:2,5-diketo-D-gluconate reductase B
VDESLRKLRTDYVDLLLLHWPSDATGGRNSQLG